MELYLDPKNDLVFRKIFGEHSDLLISFLNALMPFEKDRYIDEIRNITNVNYIILKIFDIKLNTL